jgi:hypothetical protein
MYIHFVKRLQNEKLQNKSGDLGIPQKKRGHFRVRAF